jgi:hypothetical protein
LVLSVWCLVFGVGVGGVARLRVSLWEGPRGRAAAPSLAPRSTCVGEIERLRALRRFTCYEPFTVQAPIQRATSHPPYVGECDEEQKEIECQ